MNIYRKIISSVVVLMLMSSSFPLNGKNAYAEYFKNVPFKIQTIKPPVFPKYTVRLTDFGGIGDGVSMNTEAFQKAFEALEKKGGGKLIVPPGVWYTGPIVFKSNVNMHLEKGALILFNPDIDLYDIVPTVFEGLDTQRCQSPISGSGLKNIAITGEGTINGSGEAWRPLRKFKVTDRHWKSVVNSGGVMLGKDYWFPSQKSLDGFLKSDMNVPKGMVTADDWLAIKDFLRPVMVSFIECENVYLQGVLFENSPSWNIHPLMCTNLIVDNITVRNPSYAQNGDGIDIESCVNVLVINSLFDVGDDAICIKSGKDLDGRKRNRPTENVIIDNCKVFRGHGGFVVGSEMSGSVRNISVKNCQFLGTDVGLRFKSTRGRGGVVENIYISDIYMFDIATDSFLFDLYYNGKSASESLADGDSQPSEDSIPKVTEETPTFRNIYVKNLVSRNARRAMYFNGLPEMNISNINIENAIFSSKYGAEISESIDINMHNVQIFSEEGPVLKLNNVTNIYVSDFKYLPSSDNVFKVEGKSSNINLPCLSGL